jgi:hypothetical protein
MVIWRSQVADRIAGFAAGGEKVDVMKAAFDTNVLKQVATEIENIKGEYRCVVSEASIDVVAGESLQKLAGSKVPQFVPLFVGLRGCDFRNSRDSDPTDDSVCSHEALTFRDRRLRRPGRLSFLPLSRPDST